MSVSTAPELRKVAPDYAKDIVEAAREHRRATADLKRHKNYWLADSAPGDRLEYDGATVHHIQPKPSQRIDPDQCIDAEALEKMLRAAGAWKGIVKQAVVNLTGKPPKGPAEPRGPYVMVKGA
jgi:hypothetical protein